MPAVDGNRWWASSPWTWDWNAEIAENQSNVDTDWHATENRSTGILRNSINRQNTYGAISLLNYAMNDALELQFGVDWRTAGIEHAREVRDLLGGDYFINMADDNYPNGRIRKLGDIIAYHNETTVDWLGFYAQGSYTQGPINAYGMIGQSSISYSYQDHFTINDKKIEADAIGAMQVKGGLMYDMSDNMSIYANYGVVEKPPIMDNVIYYDGTVASNPMNETFNSYEGGVNYGSEKVSAKVSYFNTQWNDRNQTKSVTTGQGSSGDTDVIFLTGVDHRQTSINNEVSAQPMKMLKLDYSASFGTYKFTGDAEGNYQEYTETGTKQTHYTYALDGLYVGDMPQTGMSVSATLTPIKGLYLQGTMWSYDKNYADWSPAAREVKGSATDRVQVWEAPAYNRMDLHAYYNLPMSIGGANFQLFAHVFNLTDALYIQDATDNSQYNAWDDDHDADSAEVFFGRPRYMNMGLTVRF